MLYGSMVAGNFFPRIILLEETGTVYILILYQHSHKIPKGEGIRNSHDIECLKHEGKGCCRVVIHSVEVLELSQAVVSPCTPVKVGRECRSWNSSSGCEPPHVGPGNQTRVLN